MASPRTPDVDADASLRGRRPDIIGWVALILALALIAVAIAVPIVFDWDVASRALRSADDRALPPLHGVWVPHISFVSILAVGAAVLAWRFAPKLAQSLPWRRLLLASYLGGAVWLFTLALVDGPTGISRVLGNPYEYLQTARAVESVPALLQEYISRIPYDADDNWVTHVAGHPPATLLFFVLLVRIGLGADFVAGAIVTLIAASLPLAVMVTLRTLASETWARRAAPFLVFTPAAVFLAVSADALIAAVGAWGIALLALGAMASRVWSRVGWSVGAGLLLGLLVEMSYGMPLYGVLAVVVLATARSWWPLPIAALAALAVVLSFAAAGFAWWDALPVITERYWDGIASRRPGEYWWWGNIAALLIGVGPFVAVGLAQAGRLVFWKVRPARSNANVAGSQERTPWSAGIGAVLALVAAGVAMVVLADLSGMSRAEVERIWLPFMSWLTISLALLDSRWRSIAFAGQLVWALLVQHLLYTVW